jgi:putative ABC transport system ATP-binding protein
MVEIIRTEKLNRVFNAGAASVHAVKDVSITVERGTLTLFMGRSGSGKTTLVNLLGTLDLPSSGVIIFDGENITDLPPDKKDALRRTGMGFVFQSIGLVSMMSAYENVEFALRIAGVSEKERRERARECLLLVGLGKRMDHLPRELSGGEQQRVGIARAIAHRPEVVFADEPTGELDTHMGLQVVKLFVSLIKRDGVTVVMTTHDTAMKEIADRVIHLEDGAVQ